MLQALFEILRDKWERRGQVVRLARFELLKRSSNSVLSWAWLLIKPLVTIFCYWFTIYIGFRHGRDLGEGAPPYILWLTAGVIPWFFMSEILNGGTDLMHTYSYLVDKVRFPLAAIPSVYAVTSLAVQLVLQLLLLGTYFACGQTIGLHLLQAPFLIVLMFLFWDMVSLLFSLLSAINQGVSNFIKALATPIFWLSGVIFNMESLSIAWLRHLLYLNPVTFFVTSFRRVFYYQTWLWERPWQLVGFAISFLFVAAATALAYRQFAKEVPDVL